jgi:hypothetical protein
MRIVGVDEGIDMGSRTHEPAKNHLDLIALERRPPRAVAMIRAAYRLKSVTT